jgi:uncharacterized membrane protein YphA (DoxX/SURF4 family)
MTNFLSPSPLWQNAGIGLIRIVVGLFLIYHGWEVFDAEKMKGYTTWDTFKNLSYPSFMVYMGKVSELLAGILFVLGLFTRLASIVLIITMLYIAFFIGHGKIWYDDQHPFLFVLLGLVFIFAGPGNWNMDGLLFDRKK